MTGVGRMPYVLGVPCNDMVFCCLDGDIVDVGKIPTALDVILECIKGVCDG